jgi:ISXO2-like transposase domain
MLPTYISLTDIFNDEAECIRFLLEREVFYQVNQCDECGAEVTLSGKAYQCKRRKCRKKVSLLRGSIFANSKLSCNKVLHLGYLWLVGCSHKTIMDTTGFSKPTITKFLEYFRQLVGCALDADDMVIGGPGVVVEIDESKFGKRKYHRGHHVEGVWVVGGVERTNQRLMFAEVVERRDAQTLIDVISRHVANGSIVHTDMWGGYSRLEELLNVQHRTVNHSHHFVNPEDGSHTNSIEGTWNGIKLKVAPRNRTREGMNGHLLEFIWRRKHAEDLWNNFISALGDIHFE